jgi:3-methyladenine DNA glycosylase AlkD
MNKNIQPLLDIFEANQNPKTAQKQSAYMRNQFAFYGIATPLRKKLQQPFLKKDALPPKELLTPTI